MIDRVKSIIIYVIYYSKKRNVLEDSNFVYSEQMMFCLKIEGAVSYSKINIKHFFFQVRFCFFKETKINAYQKIKMNEL